MFHLVLFAAIAAMLALFAYGAGRAGNFMVAVPAIGLALWFALSALPIARAQVRSARRRRTGNR